jgi:hypothetical protein
MREVINENLQDGGVKQKGKMHEEIVRARFYFGQAARSFAATSLYSASGSSLLGAGVPGAFPPKEGMT